MTGHDLPYPCLCGAKLAWSEGPNGRVDGLIHTLPMCDEFKRLPPDVLLATIRKRRGVRMPWDVDA